ncbi:MAG TPA: TIGR03118 family protein [Puia sp.]|nr:TIGR03118 family protein [Puia sp.]
MKTKITSIGVMTVLALGCHKPPPIDNKDLRDFKVVNLVANNEEYHPRYIDTTLINGFGIAWSESAIAWVNSVGGHRNEAYDEEGRKLGDLSIPSPTDSINGLPCGVVLNPGPEFFFPGGPSTLIFSGFDGVISAWNGGITAGRIKAPRGASYTGLAIATDNLNHNFLYAANFGQKKIDVWDEDFHKVDYPFYDPDMPAAYSPYNIQAVGQYLFVIYGQLATAHDPNPGHGVAGPGKGFVDVFSLDGRLVKRFASRGALNLPWGVTAAPASFLEGKDLSGGEGLHGGNDRSNYGGGNGGDDQESLILVGNFGDGRINVFTVEGKFLGQLQSHNHVLEVEGLWSLSFPPAGAHVDPRRLYFTAGPDNEADGVFGYLRKQ